MKHHQMNSKELVIGAAVGSLLGSVAALLMAPQSGKDLRQDICDTYCDISHKTQDLANRGKSLAKSMGCQTCDFASQAKSAVAGAAKNVKGWVYEEEEEEDAYDTAKDLLIGGFAGAILGAAVGLFLAPKSGESLRQDIADAYEDVSDRTQDFAYNVRKKGKSFAKTANSKAGKWLNIAQQVVDDLTENVQGTGDELFEKAKSLIPNHKVQDVIDWASLGYRLWNGIKSKR